MKLYSKPVGEIGTNCYILVSEKGNAIVVDPGAQALRLIELIEDKKLQVSMILLTHGHHDHIGAVNAIKKKFGAKVYIGEKDAEMLSDPAKSLASARHSNTEEYLIEPSGTLREGDELELDELTVEVLDTPGHTLGGVCYLSGDLMFSGDTLFAGDVGRCDLYGGNYTVMKQSLAKIAALEKDYHILPGHGPDTTLAQEKETNLYLGTQDYDTYF